MHAFVRLVAVAACAVAAASAANAQVRQSRATTIAPAPSASARTATATPNPAGLRPIFPAGISSGSGAAVSTDPIAASTSPIPAGTGAAMTATTTTGVTVPAELFPADGTVTNIGAVTTVPATNVMGAGATVPGPAQRIGGAGGFAAADVARSFFFADANHDGELTRAEARRLSISTMSFEEMDRNFDGVISRFEYDDSLR
jgi:hypothetical protein